MTNIKITPASLQLFRDLYEDAGNWGGTPLWGGNVGGGREDRGNLTHLKKLGLVTADVDEGDTWIHFTDLGHEFAKSLEAPAEVAAPAKKSEAAKNPSYKSSLDWILNNDDTDWLDEEGASPSVTAAFAADIFGISMEKLVADLKKRQA